MGLCGSKSVKAAATPAKIDKTLLEPQAAEKASFPMFLDSICNSDCLVADKSGTILRVVDIQGGPVGLWNNRARTDKVNKGDFVVKVRRAQPKGAEWCEGDANRMLELLKAAGPFELEVKRAAPENVEEAAKPVEPVEEVAVQESAKEQAAPNVEAAIVTSKSGVEMAVEEPAPVAEDKAKELLAQATVTKVEEDLSPKADVGAEEQTQQQSEAADAEIVEVETGYANTCGFRLC